MEGSQISVSKIRDNIETVLAILTLEYHCKNYLAGDNKSRNEAVRALLLDCMNSLDTTAINIIG